MAQKEKNGDSGKTKIGRDAKTGQFISVEEAEEHPNTSVVETIKRGKSNFCKRSGGFCCLSSPFEGEGDFKSLSALLRQA
jgi:hypothetical protein